MLGLGLGIIDIVVWALDSVGSGGAAFSPSLDFSDSRNGQYTSVAGF